MSVTRSKLGVAALGLLCGSIALAGGIPPDAVFQRVLLNSAPAAAQSANSPNEEPIQEIEISAPEPRYVAPTLRDRIGRIWAPVLINGKGPYKMVLDTGANHSAVTKAVAASLGMQLDPASQVLLHGVTGSANVPTIRAESLLFGDLMVEAVMLPIVPDALGGAQGVLGTEGLVDKRVSIDFMHDLITIRRSHGRMRETGYIVVPVELNKDHLLVTRVRIGGVWAKAIIDTGAQSSVANVALLDALQKRSHYKLTEDKVIGTTDDVQNGLGTSLPSIQLGSIRIEGARITMGDLQIFDSWKMKDEPVVLIGMDTIGLVEEFIIDYARRELIIRPHGNGGVEIGDSARGDCVMLRLNRC
jgi:predicted aspartyl protease